MKDFDQKSLMDIDHLVDLKVLCECKFDMQQELFIVSPNAYPGLADGF